MLTTKYLDELTYRKFGCGIEGQITFVNEYFSKLPNS